MFRVTRLPAVQSLIFASARIDPVTDPHETIRCCFAALAVTRNLIDDSAIYAATMNVNTINPLRVKPFLQLRKRGCRIAGVAVIVNIVHCTIRLIYNEVKIRPMYNGDVIVL